MTLKFGLEGKATDVRSYSGTLSALILEQYTQTFCQSVGYVLAKANARGLFSPLRTAFAYSLF